LAPREWALARFGLDIDHPEDLAVFAKTPSPTATWRYLQSLGLRESSPDRLPEGLGGILEDAVAGHRPDDAASLALADCVDLPALMAASAAIRDAGFGNLVTYSRKVFVPLTHLCRDSCHYCTFAHPPRAGDAAFLDPDAVLEIAESGRRAGCKEVLFTLGDKPEWRYRVAREALARLGHATTLDYLGAIAGRVLAETGLLPHLNPGVMSLAEIRRLRPVAGSMGLMLESASARLSEPGGPHYGSPDKHPAARLASIAAAGEAAVPFTSGLLIGIGETRRERIESLLALRALNDRYGHLQEVIIQNFCAKPDTRMKQAPEPSFEDHLWTVAVARIILGPAISVQAPPNLSAGSLEQLIQAGINDWGGISPVTPDHVNPEAPWPQIDRLAQVTAGAGKLLTERLTLYPRHIADAERWVDPQVKPAVLRLSDAAGLGRPNGWAPGSSMTLPPLEPRHPMRRPGGQGRDRLERFLEQAAAGEELAESEIVALFEARGEDFWRVCSAADALRRQVNGDSVSYIVNRNITYTNVCSFKCQFCAFSKGKMSENLRGRPYDYDLPEIARRTREAWDRGATEVCIQGGIHPSYTGRRYLEILDAVKTAVPDIHVHAFSPLEISQGAATLGLTVRDFLCDLRRAGLGTLPGTAAEILDDEVRRIICPDKLDSAAWLSVVETAHDLGLRTTATILFGHVEQPLHWARHLLLLRRLQARSGGFTEFVPLPFVAAETPIYLKGRSRFGPTLREAVLMHAVARLVLHPLIPNIQSSWVKMGIDGVLLCLKAGANEFGGTLMNENISRSAGAAHGQELSPDRMVAAIQSLGRRPRQRTTLYENAPEVEPAIYS
jgi:FO synthase